MAGPTPLSAVDIPCWIPDMLRHPGAMSSVTGSRLNGCKWVGLWVCGQVLTGQSAGALVPVIRQARRPAAWLCLDSVTGSVLGSVSVIRRVGGGVGVVDF